MGRFDEHSERILGFVREGLTLTESCERVGASYATCRKWISAGPQGAGRLRSESARPHLLGE